MNNNIIKTIDECSTTELEKERDELIKEYIGVFEKPQAYYYKLVDLNREITLKKED